MPKLEKNLRLLAERYRVDRPREFKLAACDPGETAGLKSKEVVAGHLERGIARLADLQEKLYAQDRFAVLLVFQALDAAGKDSTIKHVLSGINPQGCQVFSFKAPSAEELDHDFLWRCAKALPERGRIGIFNRSYYEEVLVVRVHPEFLGGQRLPAKTSGERLWTERFEDIVAFERHLVRSGTAIRKFYLHLSRDEQRKRFLERLEQPEKNWKFAHPDLAERARWDDYMAAYEAMIRATSTKEAPWYVVPADHKWFTRLVVADAVIDALESLGVAFPELDEKAKAALATAKRQLLAEGDGKQK